MVEAILLLCGSRGRCCGLIRLGRCGWPVRFFRNLRLLVEVVLPSDVVVYGVADGRDSECIVHFFATVSVSVCLLECVVHGIASPTN